MNDSYPSRFIWLATAAALVLSVVWAQPAVAQRIRKKPPRLNWHEVKREAGIVVFAKEYENKRLPSFRAVGIINAGIFEILAVLEDTRRHPEWLERCMEARELERTSQTTGIYYSRTDVPWPLSDRDVVMSVRISFDPDKGEATSRFHAVRYGPVPEKDGVVRIKRLDGFVHLKAISAHRTHVTYQVDADPGGSIPSWLAKMITREIPIKTIKALRKQIKKERRSYAPQIALWKKRLQP